jgi:uncharacterized repeat protein (TIGR01451 family)
MKFGVCSLVVGGSVLMLLGAWRTRSAGPQAPRSTGASVASARTAGPRAVENYGKLPLSFEVNQGQTDEQVKFLARGEGYTLFLTSQEAVLALQKSEVGGQRVTRTTLEMKVVGTNAKVRVMGAEELLGKSNYFIGNDPKEWRTNIPTYAKVRVEDVYPGIDLVYYGNRGQLEYDFVVRPGADPKVIRLGLTGASLTKVDAEGDLVVQADGGEVCWHKPVMYQLASTGKTQETAERIPVDGEFTVNGESEVAFNIGDYDGSKALVIDPVLVYSTYLGGSTSTGPYATTSVSAIAVDSSGGAYVAGSTATSDFPTTPYAFQTANHGSGNAFVSKFTADGSAVVYSTYLGGTGGDVANGLAIDGAGDAYVTGTTRSTDFPTVNPLQATGHWNTFFCCASTSFVAKLNGTGSGLIYSTYLGSAQGGGDVGDVAKGIAVDGSGNAYVTGYTDSADFPTANAIQPTNHSHSDPATNGFVSEINPSGSALVYSTYLGGSGNATGGDENDAIAVDGAGNAFVTGFTRSTDFPTTPNALQSTCTPGPAGCNEGFVTKINLGGTALAYSTYLAQAGLCEGIAVDGGGNAYVTGVSVIVAKLNPTGSSLVYFTQLGTGQQAGTGIAVGSSGSAYITGYTYSNSFPAVNAVQATNRAYAAGYENAFVAQVTPDGSGLVYSTYLGGSTSTEGNGIAVDASGNAYVTGFTRSSDFPVTSNAFQSTNRTFNGYYYVATGFVTKISPATADLDIANNASGVAMSGSTLTYSITVTNNGPDAASNVNIQDAIPAGTNFNSVATTSGSCTAPAPGSAGTVNCTAPALASGSAITETLTVNVTAGLLSTITDTATVSSTTFDPTSNTSATATTTVVGMPTIGGPGGGIMAVNGRRIFY